MSIQVTPIPRLTVLAVPAFTLGTSNAAGSATTAVSSDSTLLAFDGTDPDAITFGQSAVVGVATVASRRDHAHAMATETTGATQVQMEAETDVDAFVPPDLVKYSPGVAKVWFKHVHFTTVPASYNVTSVANNSTGVYTVTIANDMSSVNYCIVGSATGAVTNFRFVQPDYYNQTAGSFQMDVSQADVLTDANLMAAAFGDI